MNLVNRPLMNHPIPKSLHYHHDSTPGSHQQPRNPAPITQARSATPTHIRERHFAAREPTDNTAAAPPPPNPQTPPNPKTPPNPQPNTTKHTNSPNKQGCRPTKTPTQNEQPHPLQRTEQSATLPVPPTTPAPSLTPPCTPAAGTGLHPRDSHLPSHSPTSIVVTRRTGYTP